MDETPRRTDRWLPVLGLALIAEGVAIAALPLQQGVASRALAVVAGALGLVTLLRFFRPGSNPASWADAGFAVFAFGVILIADSYVTWSPILANSVPAHLLYLQIPARTLMLGGAALFWGAALARREHLQDEKLARLGRIGAGIAQLGFVFVFIQDLPSWGQFGRSPTGGTAAFAVGSLLRLVVRLVLLWASIEMMRSGSDPGVLRRRFTGVHHLLIAWMTLMVVAGVLSSYGVTRSTSSLPFLWRQIVIDTAVVTTAFTLARRFRSLPMEQAAAA